jgi:7-carboxy-7-deazaguanine synthase
MKDRSADVVSPGENPTTEPGYLSEIFCSIQGEGIYVGVTQIFLRLAGCSFCCGYCDTREAAVRPDEYVVYGIEPTKRTFPNPVSASVLSADIEKAVRSTPGLHSLSVTGGEPLEQPDFLEVFLPLFRRSGVPVYLETNGLHEIAAARIAPLVDIVSMDIKLPSLCLPGAGPREPGMGDSGSGKVDISGDVDDPCGSINSSDDIFDIYSRVIPIFAQNEFFVKVVIDDSFDRGEFERAVALVARTDSSIPFVIQPMTSPGSGRFRPPTSEKLMFAREIAAAELEDVKIIPQCHKLFGIR